jgi:hypothetical protein
MVKIKIIFIITSIILSICTAPYKPINQLTDEGNVIQENIEKYLRTAKIVSITIDPAGGRTEAWLIILNDGKISRKGYFKYVDRSRPALLADSYKYELAAYELDKLLKLNVVPPVVEREIKSVEGSLQLFIENCITENQRKRTNIEPNNPKFFQKALNDITIFENLTCNEPADLDDVLIHEKDWKVWRIDFSQAFSPRPQLLPDSNITHCSEKLYQNLLKLNDDALISRLKPFLNDEEIMALLKRKEVIIKKIRQLIKEEGEASVLLP